MTGNRMGLLAINIMAQLQCEEYDDCNSQFNKGLVGFPVKYIKIL